MWIQESTVADLIIHAASSILAKAIYRRIVLNYGNKFGIIRHAY
jgi:hypothetical protein